MRDFVNFKKSVDQKMERKSKNRGLSKKEKVTPSRETQKHIDRWKRKMDAELERCAVELVDHALENGKNHIGMEDLGQFGKMFTRSDEFEGFKYSRLCSSLNLASLAETVKGIAYRKGLTFSLLPAQYSSQRCNKCNHIDRANRKTQEEFECVKCGHKENADFSSSDNLKEIADEDVLRSHLLEANELGELVPKKLSKWKIKDILSNSHGYNNKLTIDVGALDECLKSSAIR
jgi:putative transposase